MCVHFFRFSTFVRIYFPTNTYLQFVRELNARQEEFFAIWDDIEKYLQKMYGLHNNFSQLLWNKRINARGN